MKRNSFVTAAALASVLLFICSASAAQFTFNDILNSAPVKKASAKKLPAANGSERKSKKRLIKARSAPLKAAAVADPGSGFGQGSSAGSGSGAGAGTGHGSGGSGVRRGFGGGGGGSPHGSGGVSDTGLGVASDGGGRGANTALQDDITKVQFVVIAQAKESDNGQAHPSSPQVTVDVEAPIPGCRPFDWLFIPHCSDAAPRSDVHLPKFSMVKLPRAYLHIFQLPYGWKNARIKLLAFGKCQSSRTAAMRAARTGDSLCRTAQFRITNKIRKKECRRVRFRKCKFFRLRCKTRHRTKCTTRIATTFMECSRAFMVIRVFTATDQIPQVLATTGGVYTGFRSCNDATAAKYFTK